MKQTKQVSWLGDEVFRQRKNISFVIVGKEYKTNQWDKTETVLNLKDEETTKIYCMSVWGKNLDFLIDKFGDDDDLWLKKRIQISLVVDVETSKNMRIIS